MPLDHRTASLPFRSPFGGVASWRPLVAVLPFAAPAEHPELHSLSGELADLLRERLGEDPALHAILISSDFLAKAPPHALELACRQLGVGYVISGKCHGGGAHPSLYLEMADTRDWTIHWAHFFRGDARSLLPEGSEDMAMLVEVLRHELATRRPQ